MRCRSWSDPPIVCLQKAKLVAEIFQGLSIRKGRRAWYSSTVSRKSLGVAVNCSRNQAETEVPTNRSISSGVAPKVAWDKNRTVLASVAKGAASTVGGSTGLSGTSIPLACWELSSNAPNRLACAGAAMSSGTTRVTTKRPTAFRVKMRSLPSCCIGLDRFISGNLMHPLTQSTGQRGIPAVKNHNQEIFPVKTGAPWQRPGITSRAAVLLGFSLTPDPDTSP